MKSQFVACVLLLAIFMSTSLMEPTLATSYADGCDKSCESRCGMAGVKDRCLKYCGICCTKCKCVPSGTYGNKHQCPCYRDLRNSKGKSKCP